ncbi:MAG: radical SAM protein [Candidatus Bathyarchaeia archaeon]
MAWEVFRPDALTILKDERCKRSLSRYFGILQGKRLSKFLIAKSLAAEFSGEESIEDLWELHHKLTERYYELERRIDEEERAVVGAPQPGRSYLDLKVKIGKRILASCHLCERRDRVNRLRGEVGFCRCGSGIEVSSFFEHMGEEAELVPSGTIFTCGCTMRCIHCQNWTISQHYEAGEIYSPEKLAWVIERLKARGCRNANLVGGDPTPWLKHWLETFTHVKVNIPVVWNSNSYYSEEAAQLLAGFADIYLLDFKYGNNECAIRISSAPRYVEVCQRNHLYAKRYGELIIRILLLPGHIECCAKPILDWIAENLNPETRINIMDQYRPEWRAFEASELRRRVTAKEYQTVIHYARDLGLTNLA